MVQTKKSFMYADIYKKNDGIAFRGDKTLKKAQNIYEGAQNIMG